MGLRRLHVARSDSILVGAAVIAVFSILYVHSRQLEVADELYPQVHLESIANPLFPKENMTLIVYMYSRTFAATDNISVQVFLYPNDYERAFFFWNDTSFQKTNWTDVVYRVRFEDTYCNVEKEQFQRCFFDLTRNNSTVWTAPLRTIKYSVGGGHDISLFTPDYSDLDTRQGRLPSQVGKPFIQIDSVAAINSIKMAEKVHDGWKWIATVAVIAAFTAVAALYQRVRDTLVWRFG